VTALAEALVAAQRRALTAVEKAYLARTITREAAEKLMDGFGQTDEVDRQQLFAALDTVQMFGAQAPPEPKPANDWRAEPMTNPQRNKITGLCDTQKVVYPDFEGLTKGQASEIIESLQAGTYDPDKWSIPF
jgi:hypothetical protein